MLTFPPAYDNILVAEENAPTLVERRITEGMMRVTFKDGSTTILHRSYLSVVYNDHRVVKAEDLERKLVYFDRSAR